MESFLVLKSQHHNSDLLRKQIMRESSKNLKEPLEQKQDQALAVDLAVLSKKVILATEKKRFWHNGMGKQMPMLMTSHHSHYSFKVHCKSFNGWLQCEHPQNTPFPLKWKINKISTLNFWETLNIYKLKEVAKITRIFVLAYGTRDWSCNIPTFVTEVGSGVASAVHPRAASLRDKGQLLGEIPEKEQSQVKPCHKLFWVHKCSTMVFIMPGLFWK